MNGLLLATTVESIRSRKDKTVAIVLGTQELSQGNAGELFQMNGKIVATYLSPKEAIDQREIDQVDSLDPELGGKTQSQRIRNVLYKLFEQNQEGFQNFDNFYKSKTEAYIDFLKKKIN